jgi:hypothetical protein
VLHGLPFPLPRPLDRQSADRPLAGHGPRHRDVDDRWHGSTRASATATQTAPSPLSTRDLRTFRAFSRDLLPVASTGPAAACRRNPRPPATSGTDPRYVTGSRQARPPALSTASCRQRRPGTFWGLDRLDRRAGATTGLGSVPLGRSALPLAGVNALEDQDSLVRRGRCCGGIPGAPSARSGRSPQLVAGGSRQRLVDPVPPPTGCVRGGRCRGPFAPSRGDRERS